MCVLIFIETYHSLWISKQQDSYLLISFDQCVFIVLKPQVKLLIAI